MKYMKTENQHIEEHGLPEPRPIIKWSDAEAVERKARARGAMVEHGDIDDFEVE